MTRRGPHHCPDPGPPPADLGVPPTSEQADAVAQPTDRGQRFWNRPRIPVMRKAAGTVPVVLSLSASTRTSRSAIRPSRGSHGENPASALSGFSRNFLAIQLQSSILDPLNPNLWAWGLVICILTSSSGGCDLTWRYSCSDWVHHVNAFSPPSDHHYVSRAW